MDNLALINNKNKIKELNSIKDAYDAPLRINIGNDKTFYFKFDFFIRAKGYFIFSGWASLPVQLYIIKSSQPSSFALNLKVMRDDVCKELKIRENIELGFACATLETEEDHLLIVIVDNLIIKIPLHREKAKDYFEPALASTFGKDGYQSLLDLIGFIPIEKADGAIDKSISVKDRDHILTMLHGWMYLPAETHLTLSTDTGEILENFNLFFSVRPDVDKAYACGPGPNQRGYGFDVMIKDIPINCRKLFLYCSDGIQKGLICSVDIKLSKSLADFARKIIDIPFNWSKAAEIFSRLIQPCLEPLFRRRLNSLLSLEPETGKIGKVVEEPEVSLVIPLYGNLNFIHTQLLCFSEDPAFFKNAELIYVLDDSGIVEAFQQKIEILHAIYGIPCRWVFLQGNNGFSFANNLGASIAKGKFLIFLNSDAFPEQAGWMDKMSHILKENPEIGLVGARLLYADGSLQHAGMELVWQSATGVWSTVHFLSGCAPEMDKPVEPRKMMLMTGACICIRKNDFEKVGGWSTEYLMGDFEDSDLCLKIHQEGLQTIYQPQVALTHLERQSYANLGNNEFHHRLFLYNASCFQKKWRKEIEELAQIQDAKQ